MDENANNENLSKIAERVFKATWVKKYPATPKNEKISDSEKERRKSIAKEYRADIKRLSEELEPYSISPELGGVAAQNTLDYFNSEAGRNVLSKFSELEINPLSENYAPIPPSASGKFAGKVFVITGTLSQPREYFKELIESHGGKVGSSVSTKTNFLLAGENAGSKAKKAEEIGVKTLSEDELCELLDK